MPGDRLTIDRIQLSVHERAEAASPARRWTWSGSAERVEPG